jgi:hypothetical protein
MSEKPVSSKATLVDPDPSKEDYILTLEVNRHTIQILIPKTFENYEYDKPFGLNLVTNGHYE